MYVPKHFAPPEQAVRDLLAHQEASDLITMTPRGLLATLLPSNTTRTPARTAP
ncbi:FMN-binding negative transcriptional regulator [Streptomyces cinerochromogenes]|uniref:FMN-binding negative transcriptional regulator n=1 Tax=Streptomyces cinerochromogenes TaxID=66422 RepID=UPI0019929B42|nr:FMN-binding negative transcriptional regulator [Streptomyces cinerochromogenes]GGS55127.1 hypothetical protein GCM10010206_16090 [Streptomyces cinerochromogenes]